MARKPDRQDEYYRQFAAQVIEQIRKGTAPWQKPWQPGESYRPTNAVTERPYNGGNSLYLAMASERRGFSDSRWATYKQLQGAGGQVRKGERGESILLYKESYRVRATDEKGRPKKNDQGKPLYRHVRLAKPVVRTFTVFNVTQADGLELEPQGADKVPLWQRHQAAEAVIGESGVPVRHVAGDRAFYSLKNDEITLPERGQFPSASHYYQTALHELGHSTGHPERLNRATLTQGMADGFGSPAYAKEELRAEIASMMTGDKIGMGHDPSRGAAYVEAWVGALKEDPREIHYAASEGDRMSEYLVKPARERIAGREQKNREAEQEMAKPRAHSVTPPRGRVTPTPAQAPEHSMSIGR